MSLSRSILNSLLPQGQFWTPAAGDDYDLLLEGIAENSEVNYQVLKQLAYIRNPDLTPVLSDLELEYGIIPAVNATEAQRRQRLKAFIYRRATSGAADLLQSKLREAGFDDVYVHPNDPAVDPNIFLAQAFNMYCGDILPGGNDAQCGEPEAICAQVGGELLVNGDLYKCTPKYINQCFGFVPGSEYNVQCGDGVVAGDFDGYQTQLTDIRYTVPTDAGYWSSIFFVGGPATRDVNGYLTEIKFYTLPQERRLEFRRTILRFKPMSAWGGLIVVYG
jgi:hypothetical protein